MSNKEWKEGFDAGISFSVNFANEQLGTNFEGLGDMVAELQFLRKVKRLYEEHLNMKDMEKA